MNNQQTQQNAPRLFCDSLLFWFLHRLEPVAPLSENRIYGEQDRFYSPSQTKLNKKGRWKNLKFGKK